MLTSNIDVEDGLVNGSMGILSYIEDLPGGSDDTQPKLRLWLKFDSAHIGARARLKLRSIISTSRGEIGSDLTPISCRTASITLGGTLRCKRLQFPLSPACAITIHKSQGGTFDRVVVDYDKSQQNQLVYVALSRVTSLEGLFLTNEKNDHIFYHKYGSLAPSIREIQQEYARLRLHPLMTISSEIDSFLEGIDLSNIIICTLNVQSLIAHQEDLLTDKQLIRSDVLVLTETWMDNSDPLELQGYELMASNNSNSRLPTTIRQDSNQAQVSRRIAGGVAIYKTIKRQIDHLRVEIGARRRIQDESIGDITLVELRFNGAFKFVVAGLYLHPGASRVNIELFLLYALADYTETTRLLSPSASVDLNTPILLTGDFNVNVSDSQWLPNFLLDKFGLRYIPSEIPTTLHNTHIDLTFARNLICTCKTFVSYFTVHRPLFNKLSITEH